ncbi:MAG: hypothetical protein J6Y29_00720 [Clostridiales bacterium]|nr:hypothetical protein [Clostridiales bacterium]
MKKKLAITVAALVCTMGVVFGIALPRYKNYIKTNMQKVVNNDRDGRGILKMSAGENTKGAKYSALGSSVNSNGVTIEVKEGKGESYLTNKSVLVDIFYINSATKNLTIDGQSVELASKSGEEFNCVVEVKDNVNIKAGSAEYKIDNIVKVTTGKRPTGDQSNSKDNRGYVTNKTYYSAMLGGIITNSSKVGFTRDNVEEIGVRYWLPDNPTEIYTVKNKIDVRDNDNFKITENSEGTLRYDILARSLKENETYYMQAYMMNKKKEILLGDVKEFATRGQGIGLYGLYYQGSDIPKTIKQETVDTMRFQGLNHQKVRWIGEIVPVNNGVMNFRVTSSSANGKIIISNEDTDIYKEYSGSDSTVDEISFGTGTTSNLKTNNIYEAGKKYKIIIEAYNLGNGEFKIEWMEDGQYQELPKTQLYPKEYAKISSAVINSVGTDGQSIGDNGKLINKKVITNGQNMRECKIIYSNDVANEVKIDNKNYTIIHEDNDAHRVGARLSNGNYCTIEGWIIYNTNDVVEPIIENVDNINYSSNKVTLRNGSVWDLYSTKGVDIVGRVVVRKEGSKEIYKVYDLGRYIENSSKLSDGKSYQEDGDVVYRTDEEDETRVVNLNNGLGESETYQRVLNQYSTMEHFVEDSKPVGDKWNLGIGEGRVFSLVPIRMLLSFDSDTHITMKDPVIKISKNLYRIKNGATAKEEEDVLDLDSLDGKFELDFPTDVEKTVQKQKYANWRYMDLNGGESRTKNDVKLEDDGRYIKATLVGFSTNKENQDDGGKTNVMLNFIVRLNTKESETSEEAFEGLYLINDSYKTFTEVQLVNVGVGADKDIATVKAIRLPVEIKVKPQVTFE